MRLRRDLLGQRHFPLETVESSESHDLGRPQVRVGDSNAVLLRKSLAENSNVSANSAINPAVTADNPILFVGDFSQYCIVDRIGITVEFVPHVFAIANNLPQGVRGWYMLWRTGAESVVDNAFRVMNIATTL